MTVKTVSFIDAYCMIIQQLKNNNNNALTFVSLYNFTELEEVFC